MKTEETFDLRGIKFTVAIVCHGLMWPQTALSFIESFRNLTASGIQMNLVSELFNSMIATARNSAVHEFLNFKDSNKLVFIDCDMTWTPEDLVRLMCWSSKYPIVGAMYPTKKDGDHKFLGLYDKNNPKGIVEENEYGLVSMKAIATGFCIIDRSVFETMELKCDKYLDSSGRIITEFFKTETKDRTPIGEDIYFFSRWTKEFGGEIWVDPDINPGHIGAKVYKGNLRESLINYNEQLSN